MVATCNGVEAFYQNQEGDVFTGDVMHTLRAGAGAGAGRRPMVCVTGDKTHALTTRADSSEDGTGRGAPIVTPCMVHENQRHEITTPETAGALKCGGGKPGQGYPAVFEGTGVRRLTPLECERLQGFPPVAVWSEDLTKDEFAAALLSTGAVKVDPPTGTVWITRGPGGIEIEPREIAGSNCNGYLVASFRLAGMRKQIRLHRLVWIAAHGIPNEGLAVCHRDDVKTNNVVDNLYLATPEQNSADAASTGRYLTGDEHPKAKLSEFERRQICRDYAQGKETMRQLAERYGVSKSRVHQIVRLEGWTEGQSDAQRYRQMGNSLAIPVVEWIAHRLVKQEQRTGSGGNRTPTPSPPSPRKQSHTNT